MRDLMILGILVLACVWAMREAWVGAMQWTVVSLGSPHMEFGYGSANWPVGLAIAACTLIGVLRTRELRNPFTNGAVISTLLLVIWMTVTLPVSLEVDLSYGLWERSVKIYVMLFLTIALIDTRKKLDVFVWSNVVAIGYYGVKGGLFSIKTGGQFLIVGPGGFIGGNNELALAEIVVLPFFRYLQLQAQNKWLRRGLGAGMGLMAISVLVSHSRGALLGLVAMVGYFWLKSDKKLQWGLAILLVGAFAISFLPDEWFNRMDTIKDYKEDSSALGRINSWWLAWNVATDRITGGGFRLTVPWIFARYAPDPRVIFAAHSIYFQMMGEMGFIGLFIFLSIGVGTWINASRMIRAGRADPELRWAADLGAMVHVSMLGFGVTGAFLSLAYFDLPYNVMGMTAAAVFLVNRHVQAASKKPNATASPQPPGPQLDKPLARPRAAPKPLAR